MERWGFASWFFDDNLGTTKTGKKDSYGYEINPNASYGFAGDMTSFNADYAFSALYHDLRVNGQQSKYDFTHTFGATMSHTFSPRTVMNVRESFVIGQDPETLRSGTAIVEHNRVSGNNIRNYANIKVTHQLTDLLGFEVGYGNTIFDYKDSGEIMVGPVVTGQSVSGLLDRMEHSAHIDSRWRIAEQTTGIFGYRYSETDFTADERIRGNGTTNSPYLKSDSRNSRNHTIYAGFEHEFTPEFSVSFNAGATYSDYYNSANSSATWSPYVQGSADYRFLPESTLTFGISVDRNPSEILGGTTNDFVRDTETIVGYATVSHHIFSQLYGSAKATYQHQIYNGGGNLDGKALDYLILGLELEWRFNRNVSARASYNFDHVTSDISSSNDYDRNRVYLSLSAIY